MWDFFKEYINDESNMVNIFTKKLTLGEFIRSLISNQKLFGSQCILPMLPAKTLSRMEDFCQESQQRNQNKRKQHENPFYHRQSDNRKKQKQEVVPNQQQSSTTSVYHLNKHLKKWITNLQKVDSPSRTSQRPQFLPITQKSMP
ncbi:hypothetical protein C9374_003018 [Naegleria lovaniensis]|uniref:Uncharacterized protein n=1 Tax=Naegleria lovaniensis TaxID=51637 RepID=A0AA88KLI3_NAELO|nr:uncharacterized protein C9374_003018 [Naegleria lovaniensis]KAG2385869.1 hypothetical protein C9374_003018 [Naegleria lovaniensis]